MDKLEKILSYTRAQILDVLELAVPQDKWQYVRSRVLKALGRNGLETKLRELLDIKNTEEKSYEINDSTDDNWDPA